MQQDILLFSTADWDNPFWTNKQHVACELGRRGHRVFYLESIGLRRPSANKSDLGRIFRRIGKSLRLPKQVRPNVWVWAPLVFPFQGSSAVRMINRFILRTACAVLPRIVGMKPRWLWTYNPLTTEYFAPESFEEAVYHCVDEIKAQPGMPAETIERAERDLLKRCSICFVTAPDLLKPRASIQPNTHFLPNVADFGHFSQAMSPTCLEHPLLAKISKPRVVFVGAISAYKVNFSLLVALAQRRPDLAIVMAGKVGEGEPSTRVDELKTCPNIHLVGPVDYADLPSLLKGCAVALIPANLNDYTSGMFPMKFFEYLAAGLPVVATQLSSLEGYSKVAALSRTVDEFIANVSAAVDGNCASLSARLECAREQTYEVRTEKMLGKIEMTE